MFEPVRTGGFGVSGHLVLAGTFETCEVDYWYHTPFYWLVQENGEVILREGSRDQDVRRGESAGALRMLPKPVFFASKLGLRMESYEGTATTHRPTGRPAIEVSVHGSPAGLAATGTMVVDSETAIVLSVTVPDGIKPDSLIRVETTRFAVHDTMDATVFGAETLDAAGYFSATYYGRPDGADPE